MASYADTIEKTRTHDNALPGHAAGQLVGLWAFMRVLVSIVAAFGSAFYIETKREQTIAVWPPAHPLNEWLARVLLDPLQRWDTFIYTLIVEQGYRSNNGTMQFHPLFPWLSKPFYWLTDSSIFSLVLVSSVASLLLLLMFERLARYDLDPDTARLSTLLFIFAPPAYILLMPYTEGLFLLWAVLCFLWARQHSWWLAGLAGALATLTRQQGVFLMLPLMWELWEASSRNWRQVLVGWRNWLAVGLIPGAMLAWILYRALGLNDVTPDFSSLQGLIYSVLISPSSSQVVPDQSFIFAPYAFWLALNSFFEQLRYILAIDIVLGAAFVFMTVLAWRHMRISYRIYVVVIVLVSFSYHTGAINPYMGLLRHLLLAFPVFIGLAPLCRPAWIRLPLTFFSICGRILLILHHVAHAWVP